MFRLAVAILLSPAAFSQTAQDAEIAAAAKSPLTLGRYIESHKQLNWNALWNAIGGKDPDVLVPPCGFREDNPCSTSIVTILEPDQSILIIQGPDLKSNDIYLRYFPDANGGWRFAGERRAFIQSARRHEVLRFGNKPFLKISDDFSQVGFGIGQRLEEWFDLTQADFQPVFAFTMEGWTSGFGPSIGRNIRAQCTINQTSGVERISVVLIVVFEGPKPGLTLRKTYRGEYQRSVGQPKFTLRAAHEGELLPGKAISLKEFEDLDDPFNGPSNEQMLAYAVPMLETIARGPNQDVKEWLKLILDQSKDTPERQRLLKLLTAGKR